MASATHLENSAGTQVYIAPVMKVGSIGFPTNVTSGDLSATRGLIGDDGAHANSSIFRVARTYVPPGTTIENTKFAFAAQPSGAGGENRGLTLELTVTPSAADAGAFLGAIGQAIHASGGFNLTASPALMGLRGEIQQDEAGTTVTAGYGLGSVYRAIAGTLTTAWGLFISRGEGSDAGAITSGIGIRINASTGAIPATVDYFIELRGPSHSGTTTNLTGIQITGQTSGAPTYTTVKGINIEAFTVGTITTHVGIDIAKLTQAGTNIGIRNASPTVFTPSTAQDITAVGEVILADATVVMLTADNSYTLTSTPTIASGQNGQLLIIINVDSADVITIQDESALAGSNLRLAGAANLALGPRDVVGLMYNSTLADWIECFRSNN